MQISRLALAILLSVLLLFRSLSASSNANKRWLSKQNARNPDSGVVHFSSNLWAKLIPNRCVAINMAQRRDNFRVNQWVGERVRTFFLRHLETIGQDHRGQRGGGGDDFDLKECNMVACLGKQRHLDSAKWRKMSRSSFFEGAGEQD